MYFTEEEAKNEHTDHYSISVLLSIVHLALVLQQQNSLTEAESLLQTEHSKLLR